MAGRSFFSFITIHLYFSFSTFFFFNDTATTEIYTLSLHDALPIFSAAPDRVEAPGGPPAHQARRGPWLMSATDRKSTRLNSSHLGISYAVFCLKKKKKKQYSNQIQERALAPAIRCHTASMSNKLDP